MTPRLAIASPPTRPAPSALEAPRSADGWIKRATRDNAVPGSDCVRAERGKGMPFQGRSIPTGVTHACHYASRVGINAVRAGQTTSARDHLRQDNSGDLRRELESQWKSDWCAWHRDGPYNRSSHYKLTRRRSRRDRARTPVGLVEGRGVRDADLSPIGKRATARSPSESDSRRKCLGGIEPGRNTRCSDARGARAQKGRSQRRRVDGADRTGLRPRLGLEATIRPSPNTMRPMGANVLHLKDGTKDNFMGFLRRSSAPRRG